jgi:hypothetical protein
MNSMAYDKHVIGDTIAEELTFPYCLMVYWFAYPRGSLKSVLKRSINVGSTRYVVSEWSIQTEHRDEWSEMRLAWMCV